MFVQKIFKISQARAFKLWQMMPKTTFYPMVDSAEFLKPLDLIMQHNDEMNSAAAASTPMPNIQKPLYLPITMSSPNLVMGQLIADDLKTKEDAVELLLDQFLHDEPLSKNLKFTRDQAEPFYSDIVNACSQHPYVSFFVRDSAAGNKMVGVYLNQILRRDQPAPNLYGGNSKYSSNVAEFCKVVHVCESSTWPLLPDTISQVCNNVFMSVHRDYQHSRVGQQMADELDRILRAEGKTHAAVAELSAFGTQKIAHNLGYFPLLLVPYAGWRNADGKPIVKAEPETPEHLQLVCKLYT